MYYWHSPIMKKDLQNWLFIVSIWPIAFRAYSQNTKTDSLEKRIGDVNLNVKKESWLLSI
jgi:hypothetical protein